MRANLIVLLLVLGLLVFTLPGLTNLATGNNTRVAETNPSVTPALTVGVTQASTGQSHSFRTQTFVRTSSASVYAGSATPATYTFNVAPYSTIYAASMAFIVSVPQGQYARVTISQGSSTLINTTASSFTVYPSVSATVVTENIVLVTYVNGTIPGAGNYPVYTNTSASVQFAYFSSAAWNYSIYNYHENLATDVNTSFGWWLNATTLSIPFPTGVPANYSTLNVTANGTAVVYQVSPTALYVLLANQAPTVDLVIRSSFSPAPSPAPPNPVIVFPVVPACTSAGVCTEGALFTGQQIAYNGIFILVLNATGPVNTSSVQVTVNGIVFASRTFVVVGNNVTILPGHITLYKAQTYSFSVRFTYASPSTPTFGGSLVLISYGGYSLTLGDTLLGGAILFLIYIVANVIVGTYKSIDDKRLWAAVAFGAAFAAAYLTGLGT
jgi:hypothetical protein